MEKILFIALGGAFGALSRFGFGLLFQRILSEFPLSILFVNIFGSFMFGFVWSFSARHAWVTDDLRDALLIGFLGSLTTFSTFAFNNLQMALSGNWLQLAMNIVISNIVGITAVWVGIQLGKITLSTT